MPTKPVSRRSTCRARCGRTPTCNRVRRSTTAATGTSRRGSGLGTLSIAAISVGVGVAVLGIKLLAWYLTGSVALFSDALESIVNVAASTAALIAISVDSDAERTYLERLAAALGLSAEDQQRVREQLGIN